MALRQHCVAVLATRNSSDARHGELKTRLQNEHNLSAGKCLNSLAKAFEMLSNHTPTKRSKFCVLSNATIVSEDSDLSFYQDCTGAPDEEDQGQPTRALGAEDEATRALGTIITKSWVTTSRSVRN